jgi:formylglycine-generating enzyme required for sulfatase activity
MLLTPLAICGRWNDSDTMRVMRSMRTTLLAVALIGCAPVPESVMAELATSNPFLTVTGASQIGCTDGDSSSPRRSAPAVDFTIQQHEVTQGEYNACVAAKACMPARDFFVYGDLLPQIGVTWQQAVDYCTFIGARLPTEDQWELAGSNPDNRIFPHGNTVPTCNQAVHGNCGAWAHEVMSASESVTPDGVFDLSGNVAEWTSDWWYAVPGQTMCGPVGMQTPCTIGYKVVRGGSFNDAPTKTCRRTNVIPARTADIGFRCVK